MPRYSVDPILLEVVGNAFMAACEEVAASLIRTAYSSNIKERADCSVAMFDDMGRLVVQAEHIPLHLGSMLTIVQNISERYRDNEIEPGDVFIANDPYHGGGTHLPDITVAQPIFVGGEIVAYIANIAHHSDVGGRDPGSNSGDTEHIYEEGLRLPPVKAMHAGNLDPDILAIIMLNSRLPHERQGDLKAQIASTSVGCQRIQRLYEKYGTPRMVVFVNEMLDYAERRIRARIRSVPDGVYRFTDHMDDDGYSFEPIPITVALTVAGDTLSLDFAGSGREARGALNVVESALKATVFYAVKALLDPTVPSNAGFERALVIEAPPRTIVNCRPPAPVSARSETCQRIVDVIFGAMADALPDRVLAGCCSTLNGINISGVDPRSGRFYVYPETIGGGMGARPTKDGLDGVHVHVTNSSNLPVEALETEYPLRVERYELVRDSAGRGTYRGGMGIRRDIRIVGHQAELSTHGDRQRFAPWGLREGTSAAGGKMVVNLGRPGERVFPSGKNSKVQLHDGDVLTVITPGGGGYGPPKGRAEEALAQDLLDDVISQT
jgi:N-methylhydantoinase B